MDVDFLADQTLPEASVEIIRALGNTLELDEADDAVSREGILRRAVDEHRVFLTFELAYYEQMFDGDAPRPPGVVCFQMDWETPRDPANVLSAALTDDDIELEGYFTLLDEDSLRQRPYDPSTN